MYFKAGDHDSPTQICMKQFEPKAEYLMSLLCRFALGSRVFVCHNGTQVILTHSVKRYFGNFHSGFLFRFIKLNI